VTQFTFGFMDKTVKGQVYRYFWTYDGEGHKSEVYLGRADKARTHRREVETKLKYLEGLQQEIQEMIRQTKADLEQLPAAEAPRS
jgi:hypothetical protein